MQQNKDKLKRPTIAWLPDPKVGKGKEALAAHIIPGAQMRDTITSSMSHHRPPLLWSLEPWSNACLLQAGICWATAYQNHKEASVYPHGSVLISLRSFVTSAFKVLLKP